MPGVVLGANRMGYEFSQSADSSHMNQDTPGGTVPGPIRVGFGVPFRIRFLLWFLGGYARGNPS